MHAEKVASPDSPDTLLLRTNVMYL